MLKIKYFLFLFLFLVGASNFISAENHTVIPEELHTAIIGTLTDADTIDFSNETGLSHKNIQSVQEEILTADGLIDDYSSSEELNGDTVDILLHYLNIWNGLLTAYGYMIDGGEDKLKGYNAILGNETDRYETALTGFEAAKDNYAQAYEALNETKILLTDFDSNEFSIILPDASIPTITDIDKMVFRLRDNGLISQAYVDLCKAEIAKSSTGDVNSSAVQEPLSAATTLMKKLVPSPYVGQEASLFTNITLI